MTNPIKSWRERIEQEAYAAGHSDGVRLGYAAGKADGLAEAWKSAQRDLSQQTPWRVERLMQMVMRLPEA